MALTQIIGPRIKPMWADPVEWTSTRAYDADTYVTYQGDSYATRQPTPIGIQITNKDYWVKISEFNAQAVAMQNSVNQTLEANETAMQNMLTQGMQHIQEKVNHVDSVANEFQQQSSQVDKNKSDIATLTSQVDKNKSDIATLNDNRMLVIGDSYSDYELSGDQKNDSSLWWYMVAQQLQLTPMKYVKSGAGFVRPSAGITFNTLLTNALKALGSNRDCVKWIFVMGGLNDIAHTVQDGAPKTIDVFNNTIVNFVLRVRNELPNAHFVLIGPNTFIQNQQNETSGLNQYNAAVSMKTAAFATPCTYVDISKELLNHSSQFITSTGHPNLYGETRLAGAVLNGVFGRQASLENDINRFVPTFTPNASVVEDGSMTVQDAFFTERGIRYRLMFNITRNAESEGKTSQFLGSLTMPNGMHYKPNSAQILCTGYRHALTNKANNAYLELSTKSTASASLIDMRDDGVAGKALIWFDVEFPFNA